MSGKRRKRSAGGDDSVHIHPSDTAPAPSADETAGAAGSPLTPGTPMATRPWTLWLAIAMVVLEAVVLVVAAVFFVRTGGAAGAELRSSLFGLAVMFIIMATGLVLVARGLHRMRRWARPATVAWQLLQALFGLSMWGAGMALQFGAIMPAVLCLFGLFSPASVRAYEQALGAGGSEQHLDQQDD